MYKMKSPTNTPLEQLSTIKQMMEQSSRFVSLSGWSGIIAGSIALAGSYAANIVLHAASSKQDVIQQLWLIGGLVFIIAFTASFLFTYRASQKRGIPIWGHAAKRLLWNTFLPIMIGGFVILKLVDLEMYSLVAAVSLLFYGLGLVNGSKFTLGEVRFLGYGQLLLGLFDLAVPGYSLWCWAIGFGVLHIIYGILMWLRYDRLSTSQTNVA